MDEKTREALEIVNDLSSYGCLDSSDERDRKEALAHLQAMAEENERLKQDVVDESKRRSAIAESLGAHQVELEKVKAEVERLNKECLSYFRGKDGMGTCDSGCQWFPGKGEVCPMSREGLMRDLEKAEAELSSLRSEADAARPLLEVARKVDINLANLLASAMPLLNAFLVYRSRIEA